MRLERWLLGVWYGGSNSGGWLIPLGWLMRALITLRQWLYRRGWLGSTKVATPVIVVGNITVGGTGKTPLVIWLVKRLQQSGYRVGVLTRGYRGAAGGWPVSVSTRSDPALAGDEAILIARHTGAPVVVGPERVSAARQLEAANVQVIICDDGLQHYRLQRDAEIAVVDAARGFGNGRFIPAGPLRESPERLQSVTAVVVNGPPDSKVGNEAAGNSFFMQVVGQECVSMTDAGHRPLTDFSGQSVHAVAGIGNPRRFFDLLESYNISLQRHVFEDHASYQPDDFQFDDTLAILMTEKDAVKCETFADDRMWFVPVHAEIAADDTEELVKKIATATGLTMREWSGNSGDDEVND